MRARICTIRRAGTGMGTCWEIRWRMWTRWGWMHALRTTTHVTAQMGRQAPLRFLVRARTALQRFRTGRIHKREAMVHPKGLGQEVAEEAAGANRSSPQRKVRTQRDRARFLLLQVVHGLPSKGQHGQHPYSLTF